MSSKNKVEIKTFSDTQQNSLPAVHATRNVKINHLTRRITPDENLNLHKGMKGTRKSNYMETYIRFLLIT